MLAGIDYSMSCPALCFHSGEEFKFENCKFIYKTTKKKYAGGYLKDNNQILGILIHDYKNNIDRYDQLSDTFIEYIKYNGIVDVSLEDYAMGASKSAVFNIAENTAILKYKLFQAGLSPKLYAPKSIKKFATGNGNASKDMMHDSFTKEIGIDLMDVFKMKRLDSPAHDIIDSYYLTKFLFNQIQQNLPSDYTLL